MRGGAGVLSGGKYSDNTLKDKINTITDKQQQRKSSPDSDPPGKKKLSMAHIEVNLAVLRCNHSCPIFHM